jgi:CTP synthase (UTP-ammonia lyase)
MSRAARIAVLGDCNLDYVTHRELDAARRDGRANGVWVVPGTPYRDDDAVYAAIAAARESGLPLLGTFGGFQYAAVELARSLTPVSSSRPLIAAFAEAALARQQRALEAL